MTWANKKPKWTPGEHFLGIHALIDWLEQERPVYLAGGWIHWTFLCNMSLRTLINYVKHRRVRRAFHGGGGGLKSQGPRLFANSCHS